MKLDILCFSHLRWNFVYQRPQHLLSRFGKKQRVIYIEEPEYSDRKDHYKIQKPENAEVWIATPILNHKIGSDFFNRMRLIIDVIMKELVVAEHISWYYTPMALPFTDHLTPQMIIYDCMDELSAFKNAPKHLLTYEKELFKRSDLIFTGGHSLFEHKRKQHHAIYPFPSSIDSSHFQKARIIKKDPIDQKDIPHPRIGFYGVIDERFDIDLLRSLATEKPDWQFILIGPVAKIDLDNLPNSSNIHYLGQKHYDELPQYLAGWDISFMPFAKNESTKFISPTKTPEFLAGGKYVISTSIQDVVVPYGINGLVSIADSTLDFITAAEKYFRLDQYQKDKWMMKVDMFLSGLSWDITWNQMNLLIEKCVRQKKFQNLEKDEAYV